MAYAEWYVTTIPEETKFGVAGYWEELPDAFNPIIHIYDTTPTRAMDDGLYFEYGEFTTYAVPMLFTTWWTTVTTSAGGTTSHGTYQGLFSTIYHQICSNCHCVPQKVEEFITHDKWFRMDGGTGDDGKTRRCKKLKLYYRDITEIGTVP